MFGRKRKSGGHEEIVAVDATLEGDIARVEQEVAAYLQNPTDGSRRSLLQSLEALDAQTAASDAYGQSVVGSGAIGYASKGQVLGETGLDPVVDEVPGAELSAQLALVKAAKDEVRHPTPATLASLQEAHAEVVTARGGEST
jgi:hypothetical protein